MRMIAEAISESDCFEDAVGILIRKVAAINDGNSIPPDEAAELITLWIANAEIDLFEEQERQKATYKSN